MRTAFIGDVHGCLGELRELLERLQPLPEDRLIFLGDLIDRGPDPIGCLRLVRFLGNAECIIGNHEEKALRWRRHEARVRSEQGYANPMKPVAPKLAAQWEALSEEDIAYLAALPATRWAAGFLAVHGGLMPGIPVERQKVASLIRCRWVDAAGRIVPKPEGTDGPPPGSRCWAEVFDGQYNVVCGHAVHDLAAPRIDNLAGGFEVWSIDTGCVFGGRLTALVIDSERPAEREIVQVRAKRRYASLGDADVE